MDVREKLVELVGQVQDCGCDVTDVVEMNYVENITLVDHLIANGVTVQDNTEISDELLEQLRNAPVTILQEEPTIETVQEWISVKDRLPETKTEVLVYTGTSIFSHTFFATDSIIQSGITHWMPLPPAPEENK